MDTRASEHNCNLTKKDLYIVDFDGTLFRYDLLILYIIYHFFTFNDKVFLITSFIGTKGEKLSAIREKIFLYFSSKYNMNECFEKFSGIFFMKYLLRKKLLSFLNKVSKNNQTIFIITANYRFLVKAFLEKNNIIEKENLKIFGTELSEKTQSTHQQILRGRFKAKKLLEIIGEEKIQLKDIHNFFDSYEDKYLCEYAKYNILFSSSKQKKMFFKDNFDALSFTDYLGKVPS